MKRRLGSDDPPSPRLRPTRATGEGGTSATTTSSATAAAATLAKNGASLAPRSAGEKLREVREDFEMSPGQFVQLLVGQKTLEEILGEQSAADGADATAAAAAAAAAATAAAAAASSGRRGGASKGDQVSIRTLSLWECGFARVPLHLWQRCVSLHEQWKAAQVEKKRHSHTHHSHTRHSHTRRMFPSSCHRHATLAVVSSTSPESPTSPEYEKKSSLTKCLFDSQAAVRPAGGLMALAKQEYPKQESMVGDYYQCVIPKQPISGGPKQGRAPKANHADECVFQPNAAAAAAAKEGITLEDYLCTVKNLLGGCAEETGFTYDEQIALEILHALGYQLRLAIKGLEVCLGWIRDAAVAEKKAVAERTSAANPTADPTGAAAASGEAAGEALTAPPPAP